MNVFRKHTFSSFLLPRKEIVFLCMLLVPLASCGESDEAQEKDGAKTEIRLSLKVNDTEVQVSTDQKSRLAEMAFKICDAYQQAYKNSGGVSRLTNKPGNAPSVRQAQTQQTATPKEISDKQAAFIQAMQEMQLAGALPFSVSVSRTQEITSGKIKSVQERLFSANIKGPSNMMTQCESMLR